MRWFVLALICLASPAWADIATVRIATSDDDGYLYESSTVYANACYWGATKLANWTLANIWVGDFESATWYTIRKGLLRFDLRGLNGIVNACTLYVYCNYKDAAAGDLYISRVNAGWWPWVGTEYSWGRPTAFGSSTLIATVPIEDITTSSWIAIPLEPTEILAGRYLSIRMEDEFARTCSNPPGSGVSRLTRYYSKDNAGVGNDTYTPYVVLDYDPSTVNCYTIYPPGTLSDGHIIDDFVPMCDAAIVVWTAPSTMEFGEEIIGPRADEAFVRFNIVSVPSAEYASMEPGESAWLTLTVDSKGAINFGNLRVWLLDDDFHVLGTDDWGASGTLIRKWPYASLVPGQQIWFDVGDYLDEAVQKPAGPIMPFKFTNTLFCSDPAPLGDETCALRTCDYAGTSSDPVLVICTFEVEAARHVHGPIVTHEPTANPLVKVKQR